MKVSNKDTWNFCYVLPTLKPSPNDDNIELVVPNSLQMGWCESPPFFCTSTETARDIIHKLTENPTLPPHHFENTMLKEVTENSTIMEKGKINLFEVFIDDFIGVTNNHDLEHLTSLS